MNKTLYILSFLLLPITAISQQLDKFDKKNPLKLSGGVSTNHVLYNAWGIDSRREPYNYFFTGNLNAKVFGFDFPFSFTISDQDRSYQQPFNQFKLAPRYKWVATQFGTANMTFSPYTLNGHLFNGVGIDLTPSEKLNVSAMYGRLQKAVPIDTLREDNIPAFKRMGYGLKISTARKKDKIGAIFFSAKDDVTSIPLVQGYDEIAPQENLVMSVEGQKTLFDKLVLQAEFAGTAITQNILNDSTQTNKNLYTFLGYQHRTSTAYYKAIKSKLNYNPGPFSIGMGYERVDPGYQTLGAYFFNNDLENITVNGSTKLFKSKMSLSANVGLQRDNLNNTNISAMDRWIGSVNLAYAINAKLNCSGSYSSFQTFMRIQPTLVDDIDQFLPGQTFDPTDYTQVSHSANANVSYIISNDKEKRQNMNFNINYQGASNQQESQTQNSGSDFYNMNVTYTRTLTPRNLSFNLALNGNHNATAGINTSSMGLNFTVRKSFFEKKLSTSFASTVNSGFSNGQQNNMVLNFRLNGQYNLKQKHSFSLSLVNIYRDGNSANVSSFTELTSTFSYGYRF